VPARWGNHKGCPYITGLFFEHSSTCFCYQQSVFEVFRNNPGIERSEHAYVRDWLTQAASGDALLLDTSINLLNLNNALRQGDKYEYAIALVAVDAEKNLGGQVGFQIGGDEEQGGHQTDENTEVIRGREHPTFAQGSFRRWGNNDRVPA